MKPWLLAAISGAPQLVTQTFTANTAWVSTGVNLLASLTGKGQNGTPEQDGPSGYVLTIRYKTFRPDGSLESEGSSTFDPVYGADPPEADHCETEPTGNQGYTVETCYEYVTFSETIPASTGANTTAFGYTFAGGAGVPASPSTHNNVPVAPNASYNIVVPPGGSVTITYYR